MSWSTHRLAVGILLALPSIITTWSFLFRPSFAVDLIQTCSLIVFFVYTLVTIMQRVIAKHRIGRDDLFGAINAYILLGAAWGFVYLIIDAFSPGAFALGELPRSPSTFMYFSFSTLGTMGIGDVRPLLPIARSLTIIEMLMGVFFIAVSIGKLVSVFKIDTNSRSHFRLSPQPFERTVALLSRLPNWVLILIVAIANFATSVVNEKFHMPLFLDTWATSAGVMLGGLWIGLIGGVIYNLMMALLVWDSSAWVWLFNSATVAVVTFCLWKRKALDISRPLLFLGSGLLIALSTTIVGIAITHLADLPRNISTISLHQYVLSHTDSLLAADFAQQLLMESIDKLVSLTIAAIVVFAVNELRKSGIKGDAHL